MRPLLVLTGLLIVGATAAIAQSSDLVVGTVETPNLRWGTQRAAFEIENKSDDVKFIVIETEITFKGEYLNPVRLAHSYYPLEPQFSRTIKPLVEIPGNYGSATLRISIYDVVDTLDDLSTANKVFEQPFFLKFHVPGAVAKYWSERITLPPMANNSPDFDNEFSHVLPVMLNDGRSPAQVAALCECDTNYVWSVIDKLASYGYLYRNRDTVRILFPVVGTKEAEDLKILADQTSTDLAALLTKNLAGYSGTLDSLVSAGALDPDTNNFLNAGAVLFQKYPMVSAMALWYDLGQKFVTGTSPLTVFYGTDPCHTRIPSFMYAVQGGAFFNGSHYFDFDISANKVQITYGDHIPLLKCPENLSTGRQLSEAKDFTFDENDQSEIFLWDTTTMHPALRTVTKGAIPIITSARDRLLRTATEYVQEKYIHGLRYWFWNLTATQTLNKLTKSGQVGRRGNGLYRLTASRRG
jgi:hypothetical protein